MWYNIGYGQKPDLLLSHTCVSMFIMCKSLGPSALWLALLPLEIPLARMCFSIHRAVFGYEGKTNDLKVVETGGECTMCVCEVQC